MTDTKPLTPEEFAAILWPGMFKPGWKEQDISNAFYQSELYCLDKAIKLLEKIEVRLRNV